MADKLTSYVAKQGQSIGRLLQELVRIPTTNPPGMNYARFVAMAKQKLAALGMTTREVAVPKAYARRFGVDAGQYPRICLIGRLDVGAPRTLHFNAHYDVVPTAGKWRFGPHEPKIAGGWLYGRGCGDMKGSIACMCQAIRALRDLKIAPAMNIEISLTPDEETGGDLGAGYIVREGLVRADYTLVGEGGGGAGVGVGHNGVLWLEATVEGKAAHAASPEAGINAFEKMAALTMQLQPLKGKFARRIFKMPSGKKMHPTLNIGGIFGVGEGAKVNTIPAMATFTMDRRVTPGEKLAAAEKELCAAIRAAGRRVPDLKVGVERLLAIDPCFVPPKAKLPQAFARAVEAVRRVEPVFTVNRGFTDMHFFVRDARIPTIGYGPGGEHIHAIDERVRIKELVACAQVYARFLADGVE